jgi:hypothetical protein
VNPLASFVAATPDSAYRVAHWLHETGAFVIMLSEHYERALLFAREDEAKGGGPIDTKAVIDRARRYFEFLRGSNEGTPNVVGTDHEEANANVSEAA